MRESGVTKIRLPGLETLKGISVFMLVLGGVVVGLEGRGKGIGNVWLMKRWSRHKMGEFEKEQFN